MGGRSLRNVAWHRLTDWQAHGSGYAFVLVSLSEFSGL
jgi:hypothetical protein